MSDEIDSVWRATRAKVDDLLELVARLDASMVNRAPDLPGANSPFVIMTHVLGNIRAWVPGIVCDQPLERDRPAEFRSQGTLDELRSAAETLINDCEAALKTLGPAQLDDRIVPRQVLFGEGQTYEMSRREALLHPLEHASLHVGQMQMTVDLLQRAAR